ncbi:MULTISPECIES: filamentous hemagglutinin N-terminal domain-containing protein [unclassified Caballeronia]|uniref:two-partner secretion domain-containing protein n=1 Tax=unclassified Caballeronia TaxID=2646786 RepID=UPI002856FBEA|nr:MULTISPECIES: filamentous hemagglutinin N-terminal domain-containing protein [unclassified Caballeronia]MDR5752314.1 filamentous hemagglutinin N-terminal domain-containing protein [Caballeronia sp. LZ024]MDR5841832.1 filamentous hemagglutinin N-terminal domain-containing protein [Caballeronia sp. LZ031]
MSNSVLAAGPLPQGGKFAAGAGTIATGNNAVEITQSTPRGIIDWRSFSIGNGNSVNVNNGTGATLSRVTGLSRSVIDGRLNATGSFYLINPQGVVVGPNGVVTTGGRFAASTLDICNDAFMNGGSLSFSGTSDAAVVNLGKISSSGGDVFLISRKLVQNEGSIDAPRGSAELATGSQVLLKDSTTAPQVFVQPGAHGDVVNKGAIRAAQVALQTADGNVFALAGHSDALRATGTATRDGHVWLVANGGTAHVHSNIEASNADGSGGVVDTSGRALHLDNADIKAAQWNISAPTLNVGPLTAVVLARNLSGGTSIALNATDGNAELASTLRWNGDASLAVNAQRNVTIGSTSIVSNTGGGNLALRADASGTDNGGSIANRGTIDWSRSTGTVAALYDMNGTYTPGTIRGNPSWTAAPYSGLKTQSTTYRLVNSASDLQNVSLDFGGNYALGKDLDLGGFPHIFAGIGVADATPFNGQFDGMGHVIRNLYMTDQAGPTNYTGLFGIIGASGIVRNLGVVDAVVGGPSMGPVGILAGQNRGLVVNAYTTGSVGAEESASFGGGGLVAQNDGTIERSWSGAQVVGSGEYGGLVGVNNGSITQSFATGAVGGGSHSSGGGLVGQNYGSINQSYSTGDVALFSVGGLVDANYGTITESFTTSAITAQFTPNQEAGLVVFNQGTIANNVFWDKERSTATDAVAIGPTIPDANGLSTAQMSNAASFGPTWDFGPNGAWVMPTGGSHPVLRWQQSSR